MKHYVYEEYYQGEKSYWSNHDGWGDLQSATAFTAKELTFINAPIGATALREEHFGFFRCSLGKSEPIIQLK